MVQTAGKAKAKVGICIYPCARLNFKKMHKCSIPITHAYMLGNIGLSEIKVYNSLCLNCMLIM